MPADQEVTIGMRLVPMLGMAVMLLLCFAFSRSRSTVLKRWPLVLWGLGLQLVFAAMVLKTKLGQDFFALMNSFFVAVLDSTVAGSSFVFGNLGWGGGGPEESLGFFFAFFVLPTIMFFSALSAVLYHLGIMQWIVRGIAIVMQKTMKTSGAETVACAANIFLGQTEAPLAVRPYIPKMTQSELMAVMAGGFASIAGGVLAAYVGMLKDIPGIGGHLLAASVMSAPASLLFSKILIPETEVAETAGITDIRIESAYTGVLDAISDGTTEGLKLAANVGAMLIVFLAMLAFLDKIIGFASGVALAPFDNFTYAFRGEITLGFLLSELLKPVAWLIGIPWAESGEAARLIGIKTVLNEFIAYLELGKEGIALSPRSKVIMSYALCGFSNIGSIGIQIGGLAILAPERRPDVVKLAVPALVAGSFSCLSTACIAAILL